MADTFQFELVSPAKLLLSEEVEEVVVPGTDGDFSVLSGHAPFMSTIRPGFILVKRAAGTDRIFVRGGFADTNPRGLTILAEEAIPDDQLDGDHIDKAISDAEDGLGKIADEVAMAAAHMKIAQLKEIRAGL